MKSYSIVDGTSKAVITSFDINNSLEDGMFCLNILVINSIEQDFLCDILGGVQLSLDSDSSSVEIGSGVQPFSPVIIPVIEIGHGDVSGFIDTKH